MVDKSNGLNYNCEWMKNPGELQYGDNWCPIHLDDETQVVVRHGWYHRNPREEEEND
jgi:hypothetical protein